MGKNKVTMVNALHRRCGMTVAVIFPFLCSLMSCSSDGFDIAGGASDIGNSQGIQSAQVPDTLNGADTAADGSVLIIDIKNGTIYRADEVPFPR